MTRLASIVLLAAALLLAGCGGVSHPGAQGRPSQQQVRAQFIAYAGCMRSHGVPNYPDPQISGSADGVQITISPGGANPSSPAFKSADFACRHLLPNGGGPPRGTQVSAQQRAQDLRFAACMRSHGVPGFPDPDRHGAFTLPPGVNPQAPEFNGAMHACASVKPGSLVVNQRAPTV